MVRKSLVLSCFASLLIFVSIKAKADVLFEGYARIYSGGVPVGFVVNRYEFDPAKKQFTSLSLLKTNELGGNITESIKAYAKDDLTPISYEYTTLIAGAPKTIDAKFTKGKMMATVTEGGKTSKINKDLPKGTFLSTFLVYVMMKSPKGLALDTKYEYSSIAEEDASIVKGVAYIKNQEQQNGIKVFKVLNDFKGTKFISFITEKGEVLSTKSPAQAIATELVPQSSMATTGFQMPTGLLRSIFGDVPIGVTNEIAKRYQNNPKAFQAVQGAADSVPATDSGKTKADPGK